MSEEHRSAADSAEQAVTDLQVKLQSSGKKSLGLSLALQNAKMAFADHVSVLRMETALTYTVTSTQQDERSSLSAEFDLYLQDSKKKLDNMTTSSTESQAHLVQSGKRRVQYHVENGHLRLRVDSPETEKPTFNYQLRDLL